MFITQPIGAMFVRLEIGLNGQPIAVFSEQCREFSLDESSIEARIRTLAKYGELCHSEHAALAELKRQAAIKTGA